MSKYIHGQDISLWDLYSHFILDVLVQIDIPEAIQLVESFEQMKDP